MKMEFDKCFKIASEAHDGQKRWSGDPFIVHPSVVASKFNSDKLRSIAILHDVIEDTILEKEDLLKMGVSKEVVDVVDILSKKTGESYKNYILRVYENHDAIRVKIEDLKHNLMDIRKGSLKDKYELTLWILERKIIVVIPK